MRGEKIKNQNFKQQSDGSLVQDFIFAQQTPNPASMDSIVPNCFSKKLVRWRLTEWLAGEDEK